MAEITIPVLRLIRFGVFEFDAQAGELRKNGVKLKLEGQPLQVLELLLEHAGEIVRRDDLRRKLWPDDTFVDFEHSINTSIKRLRQALDDSAETPHFIETLPRRGYRFIYPIASDPTEVSAPAELPGTAAAGAKSQARRLAAAVTAMAVVAVTVGALLLAGNRMSQRMSQRAESIRSIAVLPFENLTGDPQQEFFVDGIHEELITQLAQIGSLRVISRTSVMQYRAQKKSLPEIARELEVDGILEGAVRRSGDHIYVTAQLISASNDRHIWAQSYDRTLPAMASLPAEVVRNVASTLRVSLTMQEQERLREPGKVNPEAFSNYFKGRYYSQNWRINDLNIALDYYRQALDVDPTFAPAWVEIADCNLSLVDRGALLAEDAYPRAKAALQKAVQLDETLWSAHHVLGEIAMLEWDWATAEREMQRARELNPAWAGPSRYLLVTGRTEEAIAAAKRSAWNDPLDYATNINLGWTYFMAGRHDEAIASLRKTAELNPTNGLAHYQLGWNYAKKGMFKEAIAECDTAASLVPKGKSPAALPGCGWVFALAGQRERAIQIAQIIEQRQRAKHNDPGAGLAHIYDGLGDRERAIRILQQRLKGDPRGMVALIVSPMFSAELRKDPRFQDLIRQIGYPQFRTMVAQTRER